VKKLIIIIAILSIAFLQCSNQLTSDERFGEELFFVTGNLVAGEPVNLQNAIRIGRTIKIADTMDFFNMMVAFDVKIIDQENGDVYPLVPASLLTGVYLGFYDSTETLIPQGGKTYQLEAVYQGDTITAQTIVPYKIEVLENPNAFVFDSTQTFPKITAGDIGSGDNAIKYQAKINEGERRIGYRLKVYCLEDFESAVYNEVYQFGGQETPQKEDEYEDPVTGEPRKIEFVAYAIPDDEGYITEEGFNSMFVFYGRYEISIEVLDTNTMGYNYKTESYRKSGINGGVGYFGSISRQKMYCEIIEE